MHRFAYNSAISQLPRWVRPYARTYDKFGLVQRDLTQFFKNAEKEVPQITSCNGTQVSS